MDERAIRGTTIDFCSSCAGVFLDADEGDAVGADMAVVFGLSAEAAGTSTRTCPDHSTAMLLFSLPGPNGPIVVDRAPCCGGVFLDAGETAALARASAVPEAALPAPSMSCPTCQDRLTRAELHGVEVDECVRCGYVFFEPSEAERAGIDSIALFADAPWGAQRLAESGPCPSGHGPMVRYRKELLGPPMEVDFAPCCGGMWMAKDAHAAVQRASRVCVTERADSQFATGETVQATAAQRTPEELRQDEFLKERRLVLAHVHTLQHIERAKSEFNYRRRWQSRVLE